MYSTDDFNMTAHHFIASYTADPNKHPVAGHSITLKMKKLNAFYIIHLTKSKLSLSTKHLYENFKSEYFTVEIVSIQCFEKRCVYSFS
jgi:hypothetical protein